MSRSSLAAAIFGYRSGVTRFEFIYLLQTH